MAVAVFQRLPVDQIVLMDHIDMIPDGVRHLRRGHVTILAMQPPRIFLRTAGFVDVVPLPPRDLLLHVRHDNHVKGTMPLPLTCKENAPLDRS